MPPRVCPTPEGHSQPEGESATRVSPFDPRSVTPTSTLEEADAKPEGDSRYQVSAPTSSPRPSPRPQGLFFFKDPDALKERVRDSLKVAPAYNVAEFYKPESKASFIATHPIFENATLAVIAINAVYIAVDTDWNKAEPLKPTQTRGLTDSAWPFQCMEHFFCLYFTFEWIVRFMAFEDKRNCRKDGWFVFDSLLVAMMVMETWVFLIMEKATGQPGGAGGKTSILRLFRLLRLSRLMRMLRSLPELMILIKGMVTAMKSVVYVMGLLMLLTYIFAIAFTQLSVGTETIGEVYFSNIAHSMYSLLIYATLLDDLINFTDALRFENWFLLVLCLIYIGLAALTVMNMLIGVLCEVVSAVAVEERAAIQADSLKEQMLEIVTDLDSNFNSQISEKEFMGLVKLPETLKALEEVEVNPVHLIDFFDLFFAEEKELPFEKFMESILDLRDSNTATLKDILYLWNRIKTQTNKEVTGVKQALSSLEKRFDDFIARAEGKMKRIQSELQLMLKEVRKLRRKVSAA